MFFLPFGQGRVLFFAVWARAQAPPKQQKKQHAPAQTAKKKKTRPRPFRACFFCCLSGWVCLFFAVWAGERVVFLLFGQGAYFFFFCCLGGGRLFFFAVWAGGKFFFAVWAGGRVLFFLFGRRRVFFLLFGPGACFFFAVWAGDGSSLTYRSAWLVFKRPNNKGLVYGL